MTSGHDSRIRPGEGSAEAVAHLELTILSADVVDYARLMEADEDDTYRRLRQLRVLHIDPAIVSFRGRLVKDSGDGFLARFDSAADALRCAVALQTELAAAEAERPVERRLVHRIGLNRDVVITEADDIFGDGVNVAARLQECAAPGGIVAAESLSPEIAALGLKCDDLGHLRLKNIARLVRASALQLPSARRAGARGMVSAIPRPARTPSIAVMPFRTLSPDASDRYFAEGIVDDIVANLASLRDLIVIARASTLGLRGEAADHAEIGRRLGVRYVVGGSVRRGGDHLRVVADLVDLESGATIWGRQFDGDAQDLFAFQDEIVAGVVWTIAPHVREAELKRARRKRPEKMDSHDLLMQGLDMMYRLDFATFSQANRFLDAAMAADDTYAPAFAHAAQWRIFMVGQGWSSDPDADSREAARLAGQAIERDPTDALALAILGHVNGFLFRDYASALADFERALAAGPSHALVWTYASGAKSYLGDGKEAIARAERGLRLSPADIHTYYFLSFLGLAHYADGSYEEAALWGRRSMSLNPRFLANLRVLSASLIALGRRDEAAVIARALLERQPRFRLSEYRLRCPFVPAIAEPFLARLAEAGLGG